MNKERTVDSQWVVASLDIVSLYPSIDVKRCAAVVRMCLYESELVFDQLVWKEIALYLRYNLTDQEIEEKDLKNICPRRRHNNRPPIFVCSGSDHDMRKRHEPWIFPTIEPNPRKVRQMFCIAIEIMIVKVMGLHDFQFNGKIYRQVEGGATGIDLTGIVAEIYMVYWDRELLKLMRENLIIPVMYKRYKDDVNLIVDNVPRNKERDNRENRNRVTVEKIKQLAETIDNNLKVTTDTTSNYEDNRLPILDVKVWIGEDKNGETKIMHIHYIKGVSTMSVINERSAHGDQAKHNIIVNELCRILKNCSIHLSWEETSEQMSYFVKRLQYSGYSKQFRYETISKALNKHDQRIAQYQTGGTMFPAKSDKDMTKKKKKKKMEWYTDKDKYESVMFVEETNGGILREEMQKIVRKNKLKIKIVEKAGMTVKRMIQRSNPFGVRNCERNDCKICELNNGVDCKTRGCVYEIKCKGDDRKYRGTTGRSIYERTREEIEAWGNKDDKSPLWKHAMLYHNGGDFDIDIQVISKCYGKPSKRLITEAIMIDNLPTEQTMNSKKEWTYTKLNKIQIQ